MYNKALAVTLLMLATPAMAGELSYSYVEGGYQRIDIDDDLVGGIDGDGFGLGFSFEVGENFFVAGQYGQADLDAGIGFGLSADYDETSLGVGYHTGISDKADFYGILSWVRAEVSVDGFGSVDADGYSMTVGMRSYVSDKFELEGHIGYVDLGDDDGTSIGGSAFYDFTDNFAVGALLDFDDDVTTYGVAGRFYFGR